MDSLYQFGISLIQSLQTLSPSLDGFMKAVSFIGTPEFFLALIPIIYWTIDRRIGIRTLLVLLYFDSITVSLKVLFHQPRPFWLGGVKQLSVEGTYGLPSGHSGRTLAVSGYLATQVKRNWFWTVAVLYILLVGISRLYLGMHFPQDVLGGWLIGILVIWGVSKWEGAVREWLMDKSLPAQIVVGFLTAMGILLIGFIVRIIVAGTPVPADWSAFNAEARSVTHFFTMAGAVFGAYAGYALMRHYARFDAKGTWGRRIARYILGIIGLLVFFLGLDIAFAALAPDESTLGYFLRFIRYGFATFWTTFLAPWIFLKSRLAEPED